MHEQQLLTEQLAHRNIIRAYKPTIKLTNYLIMEMELGLETLKQF